jgi:CHAT domain-containing protein
MDRLDQLIGLFKYRDEPLELLTLSACETAEGDDRAALGLAGIAVKAGARSAVATLWSVNDEASAQMIADFYQELKNPSVSRAVALQRAQVKLLSDPRYEHPGFWSPFLLINNWL